MISPPCSENGSSSGSPCVPTVQEYDDEMAESLGDTSGLPSPPPTDDEEWSSDEDDTDDVLKQAGTYFAEEQLARLSSRLPTGDESSAGSTSAGQAQSSRRLVSSSGHMEQQASARWREGVISAFSECLCLSVGSRASKEAFSRAAMERFCEMLGEVGDSMSGKQGPRMWRRNLRRATVRRTVGNVLPNLCSWYHEVREA